MRNYLNISEIESILDNYITDDDEHSRIMAAVLNEAETCLCSALSSSECCCGAWEASDDIEWSDFDSDDD